MAALRFILNGWLHYAGGDEADRATPTATHWAINLADVESGWVDRAPIPYAGDHASHVTINNKVYLFGGEDGHQGTDTSVKATYHQHNYTFEYDPTIDAWTRKADMPIGFSHTEGNTLAINGQAVLIGGILEGGDPQSLQPRVRLRPRLQHVEAFADALSQNNRRRHVRLLERQDLHHRRLQHDGDGSFGGI